VIEDDRQVSLKNKQEGIDELSYDDISETWQELIDLIQNKREDLWNKEIKQ